MSLLQLLYLGVLLALVHRLLLVIYRLIIHPLAKFPGPKLAAASNVYAMYYDLHPSHLGSLVKRLPELHDRYGLCFPCIQAVLNVAPEC